MSRVAILEPTTLVGKEIQEALGENSCFEPEISCFSRDDDVVGSLTRFAGAAGLVQRYDPDSLGDLDLLLLCNASDGDQSVVEALPSHVGAIAIAGAESTGLLAPPVVAGCNSEGLSPKDRVLSPNPIIVALTQLLFPLKKLGLQRAVATVLRPVSMLDASALEEVLEQSRALLAFQPITKGKHFSDQVAFNLLPTADSTELLQSQLNPLLGDSISAALQILQAPVFHSVSLSLYCELDRTLEPSDVVETLTESPHLVAVEDPHRLGPVDAASSDQVLLGEVRPVSGQPGAFWLWAVMDNLTRGGALNALEIAQSMLGTG